MRVRTIGALAGALALALLVSPSARAQGGRGMGMMGGGGAMAGLRVLSTPEGEKELNITADQKAKLTEMTENVMASSREMFQKMREELGEEASREEMMTKMQAVQKEIAANLKKDLKSILNEEQLKRYEQINVQAQGFLAYMNSEVQEKLKITAEQKEKLQAVQDEYMASMQEAFQQMQEDREAARAAMTKAGDAAKEKAMNLLTSEQKTAWTELIGKPFKMPPMQGPGGQRRRID